MAIRIEFNDLMLEYRNIVARHRHELQHLRATMQQQQDQVRITQQTTIPNRAQNTNQAENAIRKLEREHEQEMHKIKMEYKKERDELEMKLFKMDLESNLEMQKLKAAKMEEIYAIHKRLKSLIDTFSRFFHISFEDQEKILSKLNNYEVTSGFKSLNAAVRDAYDKLSSVVSKCSIKDSMGGALGGLWFCGLSLLYSNRNSFLIA